MNKQFNFFILITYFNKEAKKKTFLFLCHFHLYPSDLDFEYSSTNKVYSIQAKKIKDSRIVLVGHIAKEVSRPLFKFMKNPDGTVRYNDVCVNVYQSKVSIFHMAWQSIHYLPTFSDLSRFY